MRSVRALAAVALSLFAASNAAVSAAEPKNGGILRVYHRDSPASASIHEEATYSVNMPFMPVFNNLVMYDQHVAQNSLGHRSCRISRRAGPGATTARS